MIDNMGSIGTSWEELAKYYFFDRNYGFAEFCFKHLCRTNPNGEMWYYRGLSFKFQEFFESALYCFDKALKYEYPRDKVYYHIAGALSGLDNYEQALYFLNQIQHIGSNDKRCLLMKSYLYLSHNDVLNFERSIKEEQFLDQRQIAQVG